MRIALRVALYLLIAAILGSLGFLTWFAAVWGFNPLVVSPLYMVGLTVCGVLVLVLRYTPSRRP
jgi:hypothetical protein